MLQDTFIGYFLLPALKLLVSVIIPLLDINVLLITYLYQYDNLVTTIRVCSVHSLAYLHRD